MFGPSKRNTRAHARVYSYWTSNLNGVRGGSRGSSPPGATEHHTLGRETTQGSSGAFASAPRRGPSPPIFLGAACPRPCYTQVISRSLALRLVPRGWQEQSLQTPILG